jgi:ubiquinone/menaquinone biosynthesis C-methylase UbiE
LGLVESNARVARRYDRLAPIYLAVQVAFALPPGIRRQAVDRLELGFGDRVLEIGCGSGYNLGLLANGVGPTGAVHGVDISAGMLAHASRKIARRGWRNVTVLQQDAAELAPGDPVDAVLFSLSYSVIPRRHRALARAWDALAPGGRLVIMDACLPDGRRGRILRPLAIMSSTISVLGDPDVRPWEELSAYDPYTRTERVLHGLYTVVSARKRP